MNKRVGRVAARHNQTGRRLRSALFVAALVTAGCRAAEPAPAGEASDLHVSGFGTLGLVHVAAPSGWGFLRDSAERANDGGTRADVDTRLGVQANYRFSPRIEFVGQLVGANRITNVPASDIVSLAFASYSPSEDIVLRAGRLSADYFLLAEYRNVGFAYPFVRPPVDNYSAVPYVIDGADLTKAWRFDETLWKLRGTAGRTRGVSDPSGTVVELIPGYSLVLSRDDGEGLLLKASATRVWLHGDTSRVQPLVSALRSVGALAVPGVAAEATRYADGLSFEGRPVTYFSLGGNIDRGPWLASAEVSRYTEPASKSYTSAWLLLGRRWGAFTAYAGWSGIRTQSRGEPPQWLAALTPVIGAGAAAQAQQLGTAAFLASAKLDANQRTATLGVRRDLSDRVAVKLQLDRVDVDADGGRYWSTKSFDAMQASVFSVTLDFVFLSTMRRSLLLAVVAFALCGSARADFYLVVQTGNPQTVMTQKEAVDLFMGRRHTFRNGDPALVFDLPRDHPQREAFYKALTGLSLAQVNSYWARLMFSGVSQPPQTLTGETALLDVVRRSPNALGWVAHEPSDRQIRAVLVLKEPN